MVSCKIRDIHLLSIRIILTPVSFFLIFKVNLILFAALNQIV